LLGHSVGRKHPRWVKLGYGVSAVNRMENFSQEQTVLETERCR